MFNIRPTIRWKVYSVLAAPTTWPTQRFSVTSLIWKTGSLNNSPHMNKISLNKENSSSHRYSLKHELHVFDCSDPCTKQKTHYCSNKASYSALLYLCVCVHACACVFLFLTDKVNSYSFSVAFRFMRNQDFLVFPFSINYIELKKHSIILSRIPRVWHFQIQINNILSVLWSGLM